jgi:hypothetical protein
MSSGTVLFFESFHGLLAFEGPACVNSQAGQGCFFAAQASKHVLMFGALLVNVVTTGRGAIAQSGLSVNSSQRTNQRRQSAIRHRLVHCPVLRRPVLG